jgi:pimeloyl-ACP methyl ester carboxylesterase
VPVATETNGAKIAPRAFPHVDGVTHHFVDVGGLQMHYAEAGEGEPVVMLHGWPQHWYQWRYQIPELAKRYRVICPDLRGFGWSEAPPSGYEKETLAADIVRLLDVLELEQVKLIGHDWGGWCGFLICIHHPKRIERFVALNVATPWGKADLRTFGSLYRFWYQSLIATPLVGSIMLRNLPRFVRYFVQGTSERKDAWTDEDLDAFTDPLREPARANASVQLYRTFITREFPAIARGRYAHTRLRTPTLLIFGTKDFAISTNLLRGYEPHVDAFEIEFVDDAGHFIGEEKPALVSQRALDFFAPE